MKSRKALVRPSGGQRSPAQTMRVTAAAKPRNGVQDGTVAVSTSRELSSAPLPKRGGQVDAESESRKGSYAFSEPLPVLFVSESPRSIQDCRPNQQERRVLE